MIFPQLVRNARTEEVGEFASRSPKASVLEIQDHHFGRISSVVCSKSEEIDTLYRSCLASMLITLIIVWNDILRSGKT